MEETQLIQRIEQLLGPRGGKPGILQRDGRVMMSDWGTVKKSPYYVLAINPGGAEANPAPAGQRIGDSLCEKRDTKWSYWLDEAQANDKAYFKRVMDGLESDPSPRRLLATPYSCAVWVSAFFLRTQMRSSLHTALRSTNFYLAL